jgi:hypothetical protein
MPAHRERAQFSEQEPQWRGVGPLWPRLSRQRGTAGKFAPRVYRLTACSRSGIAQLGKDGHAAQKITSQLCRS